MPERGGGLDQPTQLEGEGLIQRLNLSEWGQRGAAQATIMGIEEAQRQAILDATRPEEEIGLGGIGGDLGWLMRARQGRPLPGQGGQAGPQARHLRRGQRGRRIGEGDEAHQAQSDGQGGEHLDKLPKARGGVKTIAARHEKVESGLRVSDKRSR
ncbi:hypothetical protein KKB55_14375 [Myxococcota bacterium]|nr:hypothetical protein [Myxococcota bacterium]